MRGPKISLEDSVKLVNTLAMLVNWFPQDAAARAMIAAEIHCFVGDRSQVEWFATACIRHFSKWEGLPAFRALYNTRFEPDDGVKPSVDLPGFTTDELEAKYRERVMDENTHKFKEFKQKALGTGSGSPFLIPDVKRLN
jgi:hypothetical protein